MPPEEQKEKRRLSSGSGYPAIRIADLKKTPITFGTVLFFISFMAGIVAIATVVYAQLSDFAKTEITHHQQRDVDDAHPSLPKQYPKRTEVQGMIYKVERKVDNVIYQQKEDSNKIERILNKVERRRRRVPTPSITNE